MLPVDSSLHYSTIHLCALFLISLDEVYYLETTPQSSISDQFIYLVAGQEAITFGIQACADAHVYLHQSSSSTTGYLLIIGAVDNTWTELYKDGEMIYNVSTPDVLSCTQSISFWITWTDGFLEVAYKVWILLIFISQHFHKFKAFSFYSY